MKTQAIGHFSAISGSNCRHVYTQEGRLLGMIYKQQDGSYRVQRMDGKIRVKGRLADAFKSIRRQN